MGKKINSKLLWKKKKKASYLVGVPAMSLLGQGGAFGKAFQKLLGQVDFQMSMFICEWHKTITEYGVWVGLLKPKLCCSPESKTLGTVLFKQRSNHFFVNYWVVWIQCHYRSRDSFKETSMPRCYVCKLLWQPFQKYKTINQAWDLKGGALRKQWRKKNKQTKDVTVKWKGTYLEHKACSSLSSRNVVILFSLSFFLMLLFFLSPLSCQSACSNT